MAQDTETAKDGEKEDKGPNIKYWLSQIRASESFSARKQHQDDAKAAWDEFQGGKAGKRRKDGFPVYWSATQTMQPAIYSRTPAPASKKRIDELPDNIGRLTALAIDRTADYLIDRTEFDEVMQATRDDFIHADKATNRVCFDSKIKTEIRRVDFAPVQIPQADPNMPPQMGLVDNQGQPPNPELELLQDEQGIYQETTDESVDSVSCDLIPVYYYDILHSPNARNWGEVEWIAFKASLTRKEVKEKFGEKYAEKCSYQGIVRGDKDDTGKKEKGSQKTLYATIWEIWDKTEKRVMWLCPEYADNFLKVVPDPYELRGFFPCPRFIIGSKGPEHLYPVPPFVHLEPLIKQAHAAARRFQTLLRAAKRVGLFDDKIPELKQLADDALDGDFLAVRNLAQLLGDADLDKIVKFFPVEKFVQAAAQCAEALQLFETKFYELRGIPDIIRGVSDPAETAEAQQLKGQYTSKRFSWIMREFQRLSRDSIELMLDLFYKNAPEDKVQQVCGFNYWKPEDQAAWPQVYLLLKDDDARLVRIDIETDSTITQDENAETQQRQFLASTLSEISNAIASVSESAPEMKPVMAKAAQVLVSGLRAGKHVEDEFAKAIEAASQPKQETQQPDPAIVKAQIDQQIQAALLQFKQQELAATTAVKREQMEVEKQEIAAGVQTDQYRAQIEALQVAFDKKFEAMEIQMRKQEFQLTMYEKLLEEKRLNTEERRLDEAHRKEMREPAGGKEA